MNNIAKKAYKMSSENSDGVERNERSIEAIKRQISTFHTHSNKTILDQTTASFLVSEKQKLLGIEEGANKNVQPDWNESDSSKDSFIKNKPSIPIVDSTLSSQSTNAIQNKAVKSAIDNEASSRVAADENLQNQLTPTSWVQARINTSVVSTGECVYSVMGKVVFVHIDNVTIKSGVNGDGTSTILFEGLPIPNRYMILILPAYFTQIGYNIRIAVNFQGRIVLHWSSNASFGDSGNHHSLQFCYIKGD